MTSFSQCFTMIHFLHYLSTLFSFGHWPKQFWTFHCYTSLLPMCDFCSCKTTTSFALMVYTNPVYCTPQSYIVHQTVTFLRSTVIFHTKNFYYTQNTFIACCCHLLPPGVPCAFSALLPVHTMVLWPLHFAYFCVQLNDNITIILTIFFVLLY